MYYNKFNFLKYVIVIILIIIFSTYFIISSLSLKVVSASSSDTKPIHFYLHYTPNPVSIGGSSTHCIIDTAKNFINSSPFFKPIGQPKISFTFYLYPELAAPVTIDGGWQVLLWINGSALHPATWNVRYFEKNSKGDLIWDSSQLTPNIIGGPASDPSYINVPIIAYTLSVPLTHTFLKGNTLGVEVTINTRSTVEARVWFDSSSFPSQLILPSKDYAKPVSITTYNYNNTGLNIFSIFWNDYQRKVIVRTNVVDPFWGYDIYMVNVSISDPAKKTVLQNQPMTRISGSGSLLYL